MENFPWPQPRMDGTPTIEPSAAREARLIALSPGLLATADGDGVLTFANAAWGDAVEGRRFVELVDPGDQPRVAGLLAKLAGSPGTEQLLCRIGDRKIRFTIEATDDGLYFAGTDVTQLERIAAELQDFAYVASHDLAEPLRMITSYLELLKRRYGGQLDETADEFIGYAVGGADRMKALIDDLLAYSRVGTHEMAPGPVDLSELVGLVLAGCERAVEEAGAAVTLEDPLGTVYGDATLISQLLGHLITNALLYHAPDATPVIAISAVAEGDGVRVDIADQGIGIAPPHQERIFKMFARLHGRDEFDGTGMGLALCRRIADRHGGRIWVDSEPERGSTFHVWLPAGVV